MEDPFVESKEEVGDASGFPRRRKRFDSEDDERRYQEYVRSECERRSEERREIGRGCDEMFEQLVQKLKRQRDELFERECQALDGEYEELFDREYQKIQSQIEQRHFEQRQAELLQIKERRIEQRKQEQASSSNNKFLSLTDYLTACHMLHLQFKKGVCRSLITQKEALSWTFPRRIIPWDVSFQSLQQSIWNRLPLDSDFVEQRMFSSIQQLENVRRTLAPVNSEASLQHFGGYAIESTVWEMLDRLGEDSVLWKRLGLEALGQVSREVDKDLGQVYEPMLQSSWHKGAGELKLSMRNSHRRAKRQGLWANRSCIYRQHDGQKTPVFAIMHQLPHRLQLDEIDYGLASEIELVQDVIDKEGSDFKFASQTLVGATITQLYSYMVSKSIRYGCVSTGEALIFCCVSRDDPSNIYCTACVPQRDVQQDDPLRLHRTAAASTFALVVHALFEAPLSALWYDSVKNLDTWTMGYDDLLDKIRKLDAPKPQASPAQGHRWRGFDQSPLLIEHRYDRSDRKMGERIWHWLDNVSTQYLVNEDFDNENDTKKPSIQDQPFCSHKCLLGLVKTTQMDENCPNYDYHGFGHPNIDEFLDDLGEQLATEANSGANFTPLGTTGSYKSLFKVRHATQGYTFIAKEGEGPESLWSEKLVYDKLKKSQGRHVPVCLGLLHLDRPQQGYRRLFAELLLLSWAGRPFRRCLGQISKEEVASKVEYILGLMHEQGVVYNDPSERGIPAGLGLDMNNFLYDASRDKVMVVNFRTSSRSRHVRYDIWGQVSYQMSKKRKRDEQQVSAILAFEEDVVDAVNQVLTSVAIGRKRQFWEIESEIGDDSKY
ncbi:hypothetical protein TRIATDRAFT_285332 [Trichoderma atroviride IMI 206040]|uniref:Protein kinase domain-containing protein n=1 Tax=Hypocrea atroviridis (strain ATCC 20476 / IMI 206040) TaxID=452589 RepID=G9P1S5_HYPAI|nr:uncharacterized protein TRIATDRAFT_285332 [Trichoderma atroviride IMI 206040]EHK42574.1 hypothetical protein TRIATDRAFT_285332 [Trichoderma atroviride IMI 206040]